LRLADFAQQMRDGGANLLSSYRINNLRKKGDKIALRNSEKNNNNKNNNNKSKHTNNAVSGFRFENKLVHDMNRRRLSLRISVLHIAEHKGLEFPRD
jgi:hypothetical protein